MASRAEPVYDLVMHASGAFGTESSGVPAQLGFLPSQALLDAFVAAEDQAPGNDIDQQSLLNFQAWQQSTTSPVPVDYDEALADAGFPLFNVTTVCSVRDLPYHPRIYWPCQIRGYCFATAIRDPC